MNQPADSTIRYYDEHAAEYAQSTGSLELEALYRPFLALLPASGNILDAGCGSGRDSRAFKDRGYEVTAIDASEQMAAIAAESLNQRVDVMRLQNIPFVSEFDGIWACASVLHVPRAEIDEVLRRFWRALKPGGICFLSFKEGSGERVDDHGRHFVDFTASEFVETLGGHEGLELIRIWNGDDMRGRPEVRWVNTLVRRR